MTNEQIESLAKEADANPEAFGIEPTRDNSFSPHGNVIRGRAELWAWHSDKPSSYFLYIKESDSTATTWMGDRLRVSFASASSTATISAGIQSSGDDSRNQRNPLPRHLLQELG